MDVPLPGTGVAQEVMHVDGSVAFAIDVSPEGAISYQVDRHDSQAKAPSPAASGGTACSQSAYNLMQKQFYSTFNWYVGDGTYPADLSYDWFAYNQNYALSVWQNAANDCGFIDKITKLSDSFKGKTTVESDFVIRSGESLCGDRDGISTMDAGNLDDQGKPPLAAACTWSVKATGYRRMVEADIRYNTTDFDFTTEPTSATCSGLFDLASIAVHDFGHAIGIGHVSENAYPSMTMSTGTYECDNSQRSLAKGDILAARYLYCSPSRYACHYATK